MYVCPPPHAAGFAAPTPPTARAVGRHMCRTEFAHALPPQVELNQSRSFRPQTVCVGAARAPGFAAACHSAIVTSRLLFTSFLISSFFCSSSSFLYFLSFCHHSSFANLKITVGTFREHHSFTTFAALLAPQEGPELPLESFQGLQNYHPRRRYLCALQRRWRR